jgi:threonyl-tRNA synthetase
VRIYGTAFGSEAELAEHLDQLERLKAFDHRKLGQELDLFCFSPLVGPGLPLYTPRGTALKEALQQKVEKVCFKYGFRKVMTPHIARLKLYELSGHAKKFPEELFHVNSERYDEYILKPVQCPHQAQIYASKPRSYRDLPIRYMESDKQYRAEKPGELGGLYRVIAITVEDGHSFCRVDQVKGEVKIMVNIIKDYYSALGLWGKHWVSLSVRDPKTPEKYIGEPKDWDLCESMLAEVSKEMGLEAKRCEGEAALYGPKLDFMFRDALGREVQIPTVQLDFALPKRFELSYINENSEKVAPVIVHRAVLGSYDRLIALLIEHFGGNFPFWLAPEQVRVIPVEESQLDYAKKVWEQLTEKGFRSEIDSKTDALSQKIKSAQQLKIPFMLIVGAKELENQTVSLRSREGKTENGLPLEEAAKRLQASE